MADAPKKQTDMIPWFKQKTTWTVVAGLITAVGGYFAGDISLSALIASAFAAVAGIFMRQGVEKSKAYPQNLPPAGRGDVVS